MASSKVMASSTSSTNNSDLPRQQASTYSSLDLTNDSKNYGSMSMDELIRNIYGENPPPQPPPLLQSQTSLTDIVIDGVLESQSQSQSQSLQQQPGTKTAEEVWKEISGGCNNNNNNNDDGVEEEEEEEEEEDRKVRGDPGEMTLEEFLTKAGAVREEDMKIPQMVGPVHGFVVDPVLDSTRYAAAAAAQQGGEGGSGSGSILWLGNGGDRAGGGRGKRRAVLEPIDKVAQQRQRRMIKNRESAARSRERKQAYTVELESLVTQLEEENARLQKEQAAQSRERYNQLMESLIPVEEKQKSLPRQVLRRACSAHW